MSEQKKPSAAAVRIAESVTELLCGYSVTNYLPPIDIVVAADAEILPLIEALDALLFLAGLSVPSIAAQNLARKRLNHARGDA